MKVLWFSSTPCSATQKLMPNHNRGGWLSSLESELSNKDDINLHVAFYYHQELEPFKFNKTWFYPVKLEAGNSKFKIVRYLKRLLSNRHNVNKEILKLTEIINHINPDIIHVTGTEDSFGLIQYYTSIPVVISIQGLINPNSEKYFAGIPKIYIYRYDSLSDRVRLISYLSHYRTFTKKSIQEKNILIKCKYIIGRTDWDNRVTRVLAPNSQYYTGNEILRNVFYENQWSKKEFNKTIQLITTTSGGLYKGLETIVKTAQILSEYESISFEWNIVGILETSPIVHILKKWLKVNFKLIHINLLGTKGENELVELLLKSDIYCQVSHIENSPNSLCEAMLIGMPVIATFAGGTASMLTDKKEGLLVQEGEPYSYAGTILELTNNFEIAKEYAENAKIRALHRHNKKKIVEDLSNTYKSILHK